MIQELIRQFEKGAITGHELVVHALCGVTPQNVTDVIAALNSCVPKATVTFLDSYEGGRMVATFGLNVPTSEQISMARKEMGRVIM